MDRRPGQRLHTVWSRSGVRQSNWFLESPEGRGLSGPPVLVNTINMVMKMCVAAEVLSDLSGGGGMGGAAALGTFAAWSLLSKVAMLWFGANLAWFIELYSDPDAEMADVVGVPG